MDGTDSQKIRNGSDLRIPSNQKESVTTKLETDIDVNSTNLRKNELILNIKTLFYSNKDEYITKFLGQFDINQFSKLFLDIIGMEPVSISGNYDKRRYIVTLWIVRSSTKFSDLQQFFNKGARLVLIYFDPKDPEYFFKMKDLVNRLKYYSDAKFVVILDKKDKNPVLKVLIKTLLEKGIIQGAYQIDDSTSVDNNRFIGEILKLGVLDSIE